MFITHNSLG